MRLRWKVGVRKYVEVYEHRLLARSESGLEVHHLDHDPDNNNPDNLVLLTPEQHQEHHREHRRKYNWADAAELYLQGWSTPQLGRRFGVDSSTVYRRLRRMGVRTRTLAESQQNKRTDHPAQARQEGWSIGRAKE
jgi:transcriptional regulator of acetoin/glycerol metabolism